MNEDKKLRHRLIAETLAGEWTEGPAAAMARRAAAYARRRRTVRRSVGGLAAAAILAGALLHEIRSPPLKEPAAQSMPSAAYSIISESELVEALANRPLLILPDESGAKRIVLL